MHSNKLYETKSLTFQKKHFEKLYAASQLVNLCIHEGDGQVKTLYTKSERTEQQFKHSSKL
jgi:hypothetical protein